MANVSIHQGTGQRPRDRFTQVALLPLPGQLPDCRQCLTVWVHKDFAVRFDTNAYSKYTKQLRLEAVRLVTESGLSVGDAAVAAQIDAGELGEGLQSRKAKAHRRKPPAADRCGDRTGAGEAGTGHGSDEARHIKKNGVLCQGVAAGHAVMEQMRPEHPLGILFRVFGVSASGFNAIRSRGFSRRAQQEARLEIEIRAAHQRTRQTYGPERLQRDLAAHGVRIGVHRIKRLRRKLGLRCKQRRKFKVTTDSGHRLPVAENLLD